MSNEKKVFTDLIGEVVEQNLCVTCGTCVAVCPVNVLELEKGVPKLIGECIQCGLCYNNCPRADWNPDEMDQILHGRARQEHEKLTGIYSAVYKAKTTSDEIHGNAQDGGIVTSLLFQFIDDGGDAVIVAGLDPDLVWVPKPVIAKTKEDIMRASGTKYTVSPTMVGLKKAVKDEKLGSIAVVGTACQMRGLSKLTQGKFRNKKFGDAVNLKVGLFCMETFRYDDWIEYLESNDVDPGKVTKFEIKNGRFYAHVGEETVLKKKLKTVKKIVRPCCDRCDDFASEFSDISVGNVGTPGGWSTVIVRSERGAKALESAVNAGLIEAEPLEGFDEGETLVHKLASIKK